MRQLWPSDQTEVNVWVWPCQWGLLRHNQETWLPIGNGVRMTHGHEQTALTVSRPDGRVLEALTAGPPDGLPMVFHHGTPGGVALYEPMLAEAAARGLRTVLYARPGYGNSTAQPGRLVAAAAADVAAILD